MELVTPVYSIAVPTHLLADRNLSATAKLLYGVIDSYQKISGVCYATNAQLAEQLAGVTERTVTRTVTELEKAGYISVTKEKLEGENAPCRCLYLSFSRRHTDPNGVDKNVYPDNFVHQVDCLGNLVNTSNINNTCTSKKEKKIEKEKKKVDPPAMFIEWISKKLGYEAPAVKNDLYQHLMAYADMRRDSKSPLNTQRKIDGLLEDLWDQGQGNVPLMCQMLTIAKRRCWLSVHAPSQGPDPSPEPSAGRDKECL